MRRPVRPRRSRALAAFAGATVTAILLNACSAGTPSAQEALASVDADTVAARSSRLAVTIETGLPDTPNRARRTQAGDFGYEANRSRVATQGADGPQTLMIGDDMYTSVPPSAADRVSQGKPWLKRSKLAAAPATPLQHLLQPTDPIELLRTVRGLSTGGEFVGHETVRGVSTDHYRLQTDLKRLPAIESDPSKRAQIEQRIAATPGATLAADLWVDSEGRARRLATKVDLLLFTGPIPGAAVGAPAESPAPNPAASPGTVDVTSEWYDYGQVLDIQPPPVEQVFDVAQPAAP